MNITLIAGGQTAEGPGTLGSAEQLALAASELSWSSFIVPLPDATRPAARLHVIAEATDSDVVIPLVSGLEGALQLAGVPYVGSSPAAAAIAAHKGVFNDLLARAGLKGVNYRYGRDLRKLEQTVTSELELPVFVKPARLGASYGISRVLLPRELTTALEDAAKHDPVVLVEESVRPPFIEIEVPMIIGSSIRAADPALIKLPASSVWHDTKSKYSTDTTMEPIHDDMIRHHALTAAQHAAELTGVTGACRVDLFVDAAGTVTVGEINAVPGHGAASTFPRIFELAGVSRSEQLALMINAALEIHRTSATERFIA
jgi:D-alanine-D-alanine ligase